MPCKAIMASVIFLLIFAYGTIQTITSVQGHCYGRLSKSHEKDMIEISCKVTHSKIRFSWIYTIFFVNPTDFYLRN